MIEGLGDVVDAVVVESLVGVGDGAPGSNREPDSLVGVSPRLAADPSGP